MHCHCILMHCVCQTVCCHCNFVACQAFGALTGALACQIAKTQHAAHFLCVSWGSRILLAGDTRFRWADPTAGSAALPYPIFFVHVSA
jgi:hypothetical protein